MSLLDQFIDNIPDFGKDIMLNAKSLLLSENAVLNPQQTAIIAIAVGMTIKHPTLKKAILEHFEAQVSPKEIRAAKIAGVIMGMNNIYYRFTHTSHDQSYTKMSVGLRMNGIGSHDIDQNTFEIACVAVSSINGCSACISSHEQKVRQQGGTQEQVQMAVKIAAVINAMGYID